MSTSHGPTDPHRRLTPTEVHDLAADGFAQIQGRLEARYRTGNFATGLEFANRIGAVAETWDHHPDLNLTYTDLVVALVSHDDSAITPRDIRLSHLVAEIAAEMRLPADVPGLTRVEWGLDTFDGPRLAPFYAALLGSTILDGEPVDPSNQAPTIWWQVPDADEEPSRRENITPPPVPQRWHADVWVAQEVAQDRLAAVLEAGGRLVSDEHAPSFWVVADPDGNRHCLCTPTGR